MLRQVTCPQGHHWQLSADEPTEATLAPATCPVCGTTVDLAGKTPPDAGASRTAISSPPAASDPYATWETTSPGTLPSLAPTLSPTKAGGGYRAVVSGYEILGELGRGGMGVVYKARQLALNRTVALKMILAGGHAGPQELARFKAEAEAVARLQHPNIVQIHEVGEADGQPFFSLEFVEGGSLDRKLAGTPQPAGDAAALVETLARAVQYAHERGVVHRDLKPGNVLLQREPHGAPPVGLGTPKITDFGLAKRLDTPAGQTSAGATLGTPSYMAPEQIMACPGAVGPPADVYALGAILYELLTGRPPFLAESAWDTLAQVTSEEPVPPSRLQPKVPRDLETICLKCLHKEPRQRYAAAVALADDLHRFLAGEPIRARPTASWERGVKWARRRPLVAGLLAALVLVTAVGFGLVTWKWQEAEANAAAEAAARADAERQKEAEARARKDAEDARRLAEVREQEAEVQRREALKQQGLAEKRARAIDEAMDKLAEAVDGFFTGLSESKVFRKLGLEELRRGLLGWARPFFALYARHKNADPRERGRLAGAYYRLAYYTDESGSREEAAGLYRQALAVYEELAASKGGPDVRAEVAGCHARLALLYVATGKTEEAEAAHAKVLALRERLAVDRPDLPARRAALAQSHNDLGALQFAARRFDLAEKSWETALAIRRELAAVGTASPAYQYAVAASLGNLAALYRLTRRGKEAEASWKAALATTERLAAAHPEEDDYQEEVAANNNNLAALYLDGWRYAEAEACWNRALAIHQHFASAHPAVTRYQSLLASTWSNLGVLYAHTRRFGQAEAAHRKALALRAQLVRGHPTVADYTLNLVASHVNLADAVRTAQPEASLADYDKAVQTVEAFLKGHPKNTRGRELRARALGGRAEALSQGGRHAEALAAWDRALAAAPEKSEALLRAGRALTLARRGQHAQAAAAVKALLPGEGLSPQTVYTFAQALAAASGAARKEPQLAAAEKDRLAGQYAADALDLLAALHRAGYLRVAVHVEALRADAEFAPLRGHADFNRFLGK